MWYLAIDTRYSPAAIWKIHTRGCNKNFCGKLKKIWPLKFKFHIRHMLMAWNTRFRQFSRQRNRGRASYGIDNFDDISINIISYPAEDAHIYTLLAKKVVTPPLKTIKPMWIELLCFYLAEIGMIWTRDCSPTKSDTTLGRHSMQGQVGSSNSETTV